GGALWQQVGTAINQDIFSLGFADQSNGYLSGRNGNFQKTITGGTAWTNGPPPSNLDTLKAVRAPGAADVYIATSRGKVLKTDGLGIWITLQPGSTKSLNGAWFTSITTGWVAGDSGRVFNTTTGGALWLMQSSSTTERLMAVHFPNDSAGWCVGENGTIIKLTLLTTSAISAEPVSQYSFSVYPNLAAAFSPIYLTAKMPQREMLTIELRDAATGKISQPAIRVQTETEDINCIYATGLNSGNYILTIRNEAGSIIHSQKITVIR
ncbi:MAG: WD40/YVTN/BNR-like repeat-containing protein, partial [Bacteroidia bacterium]